MPTEAELDIFIKLQTSGQAALAGLDAQLSGLGGTSGSVAGFTNALQGQNAELITAEQFTSNFGGELSKTEAAYARTQLASLEVSNVTKGLSTDFNSAARAASSLGLQSGETAGRLGALGSVMGGPVAMGALAGLAALTGLYELGKVSLNNYESQTKAALDLANAYATQGRTVPTAQIQAFIEQNKKFISNQYEVEEAYAAATRAGFNQAQTQRIVSDAMDLAAAKDISLTTAITDLIDAENGRAMGLLSLGINIKDITDPQKDLTNATKAASSADNEKAKADRALQEELDRLHDKHKITQSDLDHLADLKAKDLAATQKDVQANKDLALAYAEVAAKGDKFTQVLVQVEDHSGGADHSVTELQQHQNELNKDWQDFTARIGPGVETTLDGITQAADAGVQALMALGNDLGKIGDWLETHSGLGANETTRGPAGGGRAGVFGGRQFGGQVYGGQSYLVGESGPELLTMSSSGSGNITPNNQLSGADLTLVETYLGQLVDIALTQLGQSSGGIGYPALAAAEYARSRGMGH